MVVKMAGDIYGKIRDENIRKYGTDINKYGPILLANLYSDRTHFIYELLQSFTNFFKMQKMHAKEPKKQEL